MVIQRQLLTQLRSQAFGPHALAGLGPAQTQRMARRRRGPEIVVEADYAAHFSLAEVQGMGNLRDGGVGDVPAAFLDGVENRQQGTGGVLFLSEERRVGKECVRTCRVRGS